MKAKRRRKLERTAQQMARELFTDGISKEHASRLVLAFPESCGAHERLTGTGWCEKAVRDLILKHLLFLAREEEA